MEARSDKRNLALSLAALGVVFGDIGTSPLYAFQTALEAIDRIRDTAASHDRLFIVEVMGHNSGFIAIDTCQALTKSFLAVTLLCL